MLADDSRRIITGVPQGSILESIFFSIFINNLFIFIDKSTLCNYIYDNELYTSGKDSNTFTSFSDVLFL